MSNQYYSRLASAIGNRINSTILKFGFSVRKDGSVVKNTEVRAVVENQTYFVSLLVINAMENAMKTMNILF